MKIEIPVGTELLINGTKCAVVVDKGYPCRACAFGDNPICCDYFICCDDERQDGKEVHFEKVI